MKSLNEFLNNVNESNVNEASNIKILYTGIENNSNCGIFHSWFVDAPSANFSKTKPGTHFEIITGSDPYKMIDDEEAAKAMAGGTGAFYSSEDGFENWYRIW